MQDLLLRYPLTAEVVWVQEEPRNMGGWHFVLRPRQPAAAAAQTRRVLAYVGRPDSAATSDGSHTRHQQEQQQVLNDAFAPLEPSSWPRNVRVMPRR